MKVLLALQVVLLALTVWMRVTRPDLPEAHPGPTTVTTVGYLTPIEESPVWFMEDDGSWTCIPGSSDMPWLCEGVVPPDQVPSGDAERRP